jgi:hypothetical protein
VSGFSAKWLALREPFDAAARSAPLVERLRDELVPGTPTAPLAILDLGAGAGSNLRFLAPLLGGTQHWRLADHDHKLLDAAIATTEVWATARGAAVERTRSTLSIRAADFACQIECEAVDLADPMAVELPASGLVTAAALLDLVAPEWLDALAQRCCAARAAVCFALTYDGWTSVKPVEPEDAEVLELFNRHQLRDKGFGPALGPRAAAAAQAAFAAQRYELLATRSDWVIGPAEHAMQLVLLEGWRDAACETAPARRAALTAWHARRRAHVLAGQSSLSVGHGDLVGWI